MQQINLYYKDLYKNSYGNRLNENLVFNQKITASPNLFKPYFSQYENWRNQGLKMAERVINNQKKSVILTMLDLTRYYYNVEITETKPLAMSIKLIANGFLLSLFIWFELILEHFNQSVSKCL